MAKMISISIANDIFEWIEANQIQNIGRSEFVEYLIREGIKNTLLKNNRNLLENEVKKDAEKM